MESPTFDENILQDSKKNYKKVKPKIDKEKAKQIPGMDDLWKQIDSLAKLINYTFREGALLLQALPHSAPNSTILYDGRVFSYNLGLEKQEYVLSNGRRFSNELSSSAARSYGRRTRRRLC